MNRCHKSLWVTLLTASSWQLIKMITLILSLLDRHWPEAPTTLWVHDSIGTWVLQCQCSPCCYLSSLQRTGIREVGVLPYHHISNVQVRGPLHGDMVSGWLHKLHILDSFQHSHLPGPLDSFCYNIPGKLQYFFLIDSIPPLGIVFSSPYLHHAQVVEPTH